MAETYMNHLAPDDRSATNLKGVDQDAAQARQRCEDRAEVSRNGSMGGPDPYNWDADRKDYQAMERVAKRRNRGGGNFGKDDTLCRY